MTKILPNTNLQDHAIRNTLNKGGGRTDNDFGSKFRKTAKINKWSFYKPVTHENLFSLTDQDFYEVNDGFEYTEYTSFDDLAIDLTNLYDGLPIDGQTLKWKEVTNEDGSVTRVLESIGSGGTADKVTWANIEGKPTWIGESKPSYSWTEINGKPSWIGNSKPTYSYSEITGKPDLSDMATKTWVGNNYLVKTGGTLSGDLRLKGSSNYGMTLYFGDGSYCYITEPSNNEMKIHAINGVVIETGSSYYVEVDSKGIKINGGIITYNGSYWEIEGDVLVTGDITFNS